MAADLESLLDGAPPPIDDIEDSVPNLYEPCSLDGIAFGGGWAAYTPDIGRFAFEGFGLVPFCIALA